MRAASAAQALRAVPELEEHLLELLADTDHMVRTEAARVLADGQSAVVYGALQEALADRSVSVQLAARESLDQFGQRRAAGPLEPTSGQREE